MRSEERRRQSSPTWGSNQQIHTYVTAMRPEELLVRTPAGLCCRAGGFYIDPLRPVERALVTHAHSDHARPGHHRVLATAETLALMRLRYGEDFAGTAQPIAHGARLAVAGPTGSL